MGGTMTISTPVIVVAFLIGIALWYGDFASKREAARRAELEAIFKAQRKAHRRQEKLIKKMRELPPNDQS
jgi:hypothetical protein